jgi:hypothetical protein
MGLFQTLKLAKKTTSTISWDMLPAETFAIFESWGGKDRVRSSQERFYYFFIDAWENPPALCLMERGIKHARVLAQIKAPEELIAKSISEQGRSFSLDRSYAINKELQDWLKKNITNNYDESLVIPINNSQEEEILLNPPADHGADLEQIMIRNDRREISEQEIQVLLKEKNYFDSRYNPSGNFNNAFISSNADIIIDNRTGLMWQRYGNDICSFRKTKKYVQQCNDDYYAGFNNWRLPGIEEALTLMEAEKNEKDLHIAPYFSSTHPFIFTSEKRRPGGYWFCDYKQGTIFWASGTNPGGFGRLCRTI